ncbi:hypothetical protein TCE0_060r19089 [Talaromyces pinophilus]|uniref:O-methyltransferase n=1 Tax=Talaromyces pinophilus TaxID=128442 RepID=A0A6V8HPL4_TALPI|nr:hypothetical protein TCE0_060r19089 [Talaromyces pinophilus]
MTSSRSPETDNPQWAAVDAYTLSHLHPTERANSQALQDTLTASTQAGLPSHALSPAQGKFIALHCRTMRVTHVLEVGTLGGYSAIWMASMNPQLTVTTVECNKTHAEIARANIERAGLADRIEVIEGFGVDVLVRLRGEVQAGSRPHFGFVFIDADKANNWRYFQLSMDMIISNSVICVDNVVRNGQLVDWSDSNPSVLGSREVVEKAGREPRVDSVLVQTVGEKGYDGWLWAVIS